MWALSQRQRSSTLCAWSGRCYPYGCRICAQVFSPSDYHPQCVLGGATISVFASIAMTGIKLIMRQEMNFRNSSIVGLSVALGMGITQVSDSLASFLAWYHYFRKISGSCSHSGSHTFKHHSSQRRTCILKTFLKRGTAISAHAPFVYLYPIFCLLCVLFYSPYLRPGIPIC